MSKATKNKRIKELERQVKGLTVLFSSLNTWSNYADDMLTELNHALPDPEYDAKCEAAVAGVEASLDRHRERLGLNKPQLKQLTQSVFDGLDEKWRFAAVDKCGEVWYSTHKTQPSVSGTHLSPEPNADSMQAKDYYDASNWQNSLIERDIAKELLEVDLSSELTGSELCKAMLARGDKCVMCKCWDSSYADIDQVVDVITGFECTAYKKLFAGSRNNWEYAVPINNQGEPLTAAEVGL